MLNIRSLRTPHGAIRRLRFAGPASVVLAAAYLSFAGSTSAVHAQNYTLSTIATFNGTNGTSPLASVTFDTSGNLYGTTSNGGANNAGRVFKIAAGTNTLSTIVNFNGANGSLPAGGLTFDTSGNLYGTTSEDQVPIMV